MAASLAFSPLDVRPSPEYDRRTDVQCAPVDLSTEYARQNLPLSEVQASEVEGSQPLFNGSDPADPHQRSYDITTSSGSTPSAPAPGRPCFYCGQAFAPAGPVLVATVIAHLVECPGIAAIRAHHAAVAATESELRFAWGDR